MDRRRFLSTLSAAGAVGWSLTATPGWARALGGVFESPVPFIDSADIGPQAQACAVDDAATARHQAAWFPQSVASGDPKEQGIVLWTRLAPESEAAAGDAVVNWQIATDEEFSNVVLAGAARAGAAGDFTVKLAIAHSALSGFKTYYYRFILQGVASRTGRFKTLPSAEANPERLRLGYITCQDYGFGFYNALARVAEEDVDYVIHLGDYIYETVDAGFQQGGARPIGPLPSGNPTPADIDDYRYLYRSYRSDAELQRLHERFAMIAIWDDHEFGNDCHGNVPPDTDTGATTPRPALRQAANRAWSEYIPANTAFDADRPWNESIQIYRSFRFGQLAELIATDERLYRDGPPCGTDTVGERYATLGCRAREDADRTMLGHTQRDWFIDAVTRSPARWKLWANEVMLMQLKVGELFVNLDQWDGYPAERRHILSTLRDAGTTNLVALTGDLHTFTAGYLKTDFDDFFEYPVGVELMVGSVTSANLEDQIRAGLNLPSAPMPADRLGLRANKLEPAVRLANPHIRYWNSAAHGYAVLEMSEAALTCRYMAVDTIAAPDPGVRELATFRVMNSVPWLWKT